MTNSADPDQLASEESNGSGSTLFAKTGKVVFRKRRVKGAHAHLLRLQYSKRRYLFTCCGGGGGGGGELSGGR